MKPIISRLDNWPKDGRKQPIFTSTQDALLYAQLIYNDKDAQGTIKICREDALIKLRAERLSKHPKPQRMFDLAFRAQLFRECSEEFQRIQDEKFTT